MAGCAIFLILIQSRERNRMNATTVQIDQKEEEILSFEVSDEVLESAAATEMAITFVLCTGRLVCPICGPVHSRRSGSRRA